MNKWIAFLKRVNWCTGNPVRREFIVPVNRINAFQYYGLDSSKKTICVFGGSLGARTLNEVIAEQYEMIKHRDDLQILWQVGRQFIEEFALTPIAQLKNVKMLAFIDRMDLAYAIADVAERTSRDINHF